MTHPFFDARAYPWSRPEAIELHGVLTDAMRQPDRIDILYVMVAENLPPLALHGSPPDIIWKQVLDNVTVRGALRSLCERILSHPNFGAGAVVDAVQAVMNARAEVEEQIVAEDVLVLDRHALSEKLNLLKPTNAQKRFILVRGGAKSGKSYSFYRFEQAAREQGAEPIYAYGEIIADVDEAIRMLFSTVGAMSQIPERLTTEDAWYRMVCDTLRQVVSSKGKRLWIAVDNLGVDDEGVPLLDPQVRRFYEQFALKMGDPAFGQWFRLMLIDYPDGPVATRWKVDSWIEDRTSETDVQRQHIVELVQGWAARRGKTILEDEAIALADEVVAKVEAPTEHGHEKPPRLQYLHDILVEELQRLDGGDNGHT